VLEAIHQRLAAWRQSLRLPGRHQRTSWNDVGKYTSFTRKSTPNAPSLPDPKLHPSPLRKQGSRKDHSEDWVPAFAGTTFVSIRHYRYKKIRDLSAEQEKPENAAVH